MKDYYDHLNHAARTLLDAGQYGSAADVYRQIVDTDPTNADAHERLVFALRRDKQARLSKECAIRAVSVLQNAKAYRLVGDCFLYEANEAEAIKWYEEALERDPRYACAHNGIATAYLRLDKWDAALQAAQRCIEVAPCYWRALVNAGDACMELGDSATALTYYSRAVGLHENDVHYMRLGMALSGCGDERQAARAYVRALEHNPKSWMVRICLVGSCMLLSDYDEASAHLAVAFRLRPFDVINALLLGFLFLLKGQISAAMFIFRYIAGLRP